MSIPCPIQTGALFFTFKHLFYCFHAGSCGCLPFVHHPFPTSPEKRRKWITLINRQKSESNKTQWIPDSNSKVCSDHFVDGIPTEKNPYPTQKLGYNVGQQLTRIPISRRPNRNVGNQRGVPVKPNPVLFAASTSSSDEKQAPREKSTMPKASTAQTLETLFDDECFSEVETTPLVKVHEPVELLPSEVNEDPEISHPSTSSTQATNRELSELKGKCKMQSMLLKSKSALLKKHLLPYHKKLLKTDKDTSFYTGVPLTAIFYLICKLYNESKPKKAKPPAYTVQLKYKRINSQRKNKKLCSEDQILLVLMRLRLALLRKDLADRSVLLTLSLSEQRSITTLTPYRTYK